MGIYYGYIMGDIMDISWIRWPGGFRLPAWIQPAGRARVLAGAPASVQDAVPFFVLAQNQTECAKRM